MEHNYVLWLTGVDTMLRRYGCRLRDEAADDLCHEIASFLRERSGQNTSSAQVVETGYGLRLMLRGKRMAIVNSDSYTPEQMSEDVRANDLTHVIFLRTATQAAPRMRYVEAAQSLGLSFIKQQLPDPVLIRDEPMTHDSTPPNGFTASLINIDNSKHYTAGGDIIIGDNNNSGDGGKKAKKSRWRSVVKTARVVGEIIAAVADGCSVISMIF